MTARRPSVWRWWWVCVVTGTVLVALPDPDRRVVSISEGHGPGPLDLVGALVLTAGWTVLDVATWRRRRLLGPALGPARMLAWSALAVAAVVLLAWSVVRDAGGWWLLGAGALGAVQVAAARAVERSPARPRA